MSAYVIALMNVTDPAKYEVYKELAASSVEQYGGRYIARAGRSEVLEGEPEASRFVLLEFESYERAQEWWNSPEECVRHSHDGRGTLLTILSFVRPRTSDSLSIQLC